MHGYLFELVEAIFHLALSREGNVRKLYFQIKKNCLNNIILFKMKRSDRHNLKNMCIIVCVLL